ncbi:MAG: primosomal protein N' [Alloprevotella sp.]|nr:primosomal protein N' [Alloprevotella sp.]
MTRFADILLPLALGQPLTYRVPEALRKDIHIGCRVMVPLRGGKVYGGIVTGLSDDSKMSPASLYDILQLLDTTPLISQEQIKFWQWIAQYYMCSVGSVMTAALPAGLRLEGDVKIKKNADFTDLSALSEQERLLWNLLSADEAVRLNALPKPWNVHTALPLVKTLLETGAIEVEENITRAFRPASEVCVRLKAENCSAESITTLLAQLHRARKQDLLLRAYLTLSEANAALRLQNPALLKEVSKAQLLDETAISDAVLRELIQKNILETYRVERSRLAFPSLEPTLSLPHLSPAQQVALDKIDDSLTQKEVCLLHGITASGKTEIYQHLIQKVLTRGEQVLFLVPEIALTTQLMHRLAKVFGTNMGIYHSKFPDNERCELWRRQASEKPFPLILGVRSALFLPFKKLGLIIIDEEHEPSYKQQEPAPRYHARDAALMLARHYGAKVVLGSATPSIESYYHAKEGRYGLVSLNERYGGQVLPEVSVEDVTDLKHRRMMPSIFSPRLRDELTRALRNGEQAILFQNRRGYAPVLVCDDCGWTPRCTRCDVALTLHQRQGLLCCHYCGATYSVPATCPQCHGKNLHDHGFGTEKIERAVQNTFANARVARMDLDTTRARSSYERILSDFARGHTNVLVGTQMVTKGLDFDKVHVVGILSADQALNMPDFRAYERAFQLMTQVAGRAGRRDKRGLVVLQTNQAQLPIVRQIQQHDYLGMYHDQIKEREEYVYPPYCRLIYIYMRHRDEHTCEHAAQTLASWLRPHFKENLLGPDQPLISRVKLLHIRTLLLKVKPTLTPAGVRRTLTAAREALAHIPDYKSVDVYFDVDPL